VELPRLQEIWKKYEDQGLSIVAVQSDQDHEKGRRLVEEKGLGFHILRNEVENDVVNGIYLSEGNPTTYLIDREDRVLSYHLGFQDGDEVEIEKEITALLTSSGGCF
jgi:glutathione peroxidase-family protein